MAELDITGGLTTLKTMLAGFDPTPQTAPAGIWVYPDDYTSIDTSSLPVMIVTNVVNEVYGWRADSFGGDVRHEWVAQVLLLLQRGGIKKLRAGSVIETTQADYIKPMADILYANQVLDNTHFDPVAGLLDGRAFTYQIGHIEWDDTIYWGIAYQIPVTQYHILTFG